MRSGLGAVRRRRRPVWSMCVAIIILISALFRWTWQTCSARASSPSSPGGSDTRDARASSSATAGHLVAGPGTQSAFARWPLGTTPARRHHQRRLATVSSTTESSTASRAWRVSGDEQEIARGAVPAVLAHRERHPALEHLHCRLTRILMLVKPRTGSQRNQGLPKYVFVTPEHGVSAAPTRHRPSVIQVMPDQRGE